LSRWLPDKQTASNSVEGLTVLPGSPYQRYLMPLDYPPSREFAPRWGYSRPTHPGLVTLMAKNQEQYRATIKELRTLAPFFSAINTEFTNERAPEAGWIGGPITALDLALLYHFVVKYQPATYIEIGSGCTTCMARRAIVDHKLSTRIVSVDPEPRSGVDSICDEIIRDGLETITDLRLFEALQPGDIVFVDGSHRAFMNSDVTVFMLDVLPRLKPGVLVHIHDVFLPYDYPEMFRDWYWNEQYVLGAYLLAAKSAIKILMPSYYLSITAGLSDCLKPPIIQISGHEPEWVLGGSMWITRMEEHGEQLGSRVKSETSRATGVPRTTDTVATQAGTSDLAVITQKPIAFDSPDHLMPWGTMRDNSTNPIFNSRLTQWIPANELSVLDLGCAGGGFVKSLLDLGGFAVGIEGSDYSKIRGRAEWTTIPDNLFTADITEPFEVVARDIDGAWHRLKFRVVTAWEVMEHIRVDRVAAVFRNIATALRDDGIVIMSISPNEEIIDGVALHQTVHDKEWWTAESHRQGFEHHEEAVPYFADDWVRGGSNAPGSFHLVLTRSGKSLAPLTNAQGHRRSSD
jgi:2-polyprenyl-3-methyl-5-hydroxy-6-metoxy-1,4-benzoquinol methylase